MKSIRTTTIALVGAALFTLGALTGCSSDSDDKSSDKTTASDESKDSGDSKDESKDSASGGDTEFCTPYESMSTIDMTNYDAVIQFWEDWKASAPSDVKGDFDVIIDTYQMAKDGDMAGFGGKAQELTDATTHITDKVTEVCR